MDTTPQDIADPESDFEEQFDEHEEETEDDITGVDEDPAPYTVTDSGDVGPLPEEDENKVRKFHVNGVAVGVIAQRVQYYDADGKLVTESFKDYTRKTLLKEYASLDDFTRNGRAPSANRPSSRSWSSRGLSGKCWRKRSVKISTRSTCCATWCMVSRR